MWVVTYDFLLFYTPILLALKVCVVFLVLCDQFFKKKEIYILCVIAVILIKFQTMIYQVGCPFILLPVKNV